MPRVPATGRVEGSPAPRERASGLLFTITMSIASGTSVMSTIG
jgi:hypothetical protein